MWSRKGHPPRQRPGIPGIESLEGRQLLASTPFAADAPPSRTALAAEFQSFLALPDNAVPGGLKLLIEIAATWLADSSSPGRGVAPADPVVGPAPYQSFAWTAPPDGIPPELLAMLGRTPTSGWSFPLATAVTAVGPAPYESYALNASIGTVGPELLAMLGRTPTSGWSFPLATAADGGTAPFPSYAGNAPPEGVSHELLATGGGSPTLWWNLPWWNLPFATQSQTTASIAFLSSVTTPADQGVLTHLQADPPPPGLLAKVASYVASEMATLGAWADSSGSGQFAFSTAAAIDYLGRARSAFDMMRAPAGQFDELAPPSASGSTSATPSSVAITLGGQVQSPPGDESEAATVVANFDGSNRRLDPLEFARTFSARASLQSFLTSTVMVTSTSPATADPGGEPRETSPQEGAEADESQGAGPSIISRGQELLAAFSPFDRASVERAIDHLIEGLSDLEAGLPSLEEATSYVPHAVGVAAALVAVEILRRRSTRGQDESDDDAGSPGVPGFLTRWELDQR
jgi:hypothetical protein